MPNETEDTEETEEKEVKVIELPYTLAFVKPIVMTKTLTVPEITFRNDLNVKMVKELPAGGAQFFKMHHFIPMVSGMTGETTVLIEKMAMVDWLECIEVVSSFLGDGPTDGPN